MKSTGAASVAVLLLAVAEIKFDLELGVQLQHGGERKSLLAAEILQRPDLFFRDELFHFLHLKHPAAQRFPDREVALFVDALELLVFFVDLAAAFRARHFQHAEIAGNRVFLEFFGALDDVPRHVGNLGHEFVAALLPALDLVQLEFPIAGQLRLGQFGNAQSVEQFHQRKRLGRRLQLAPVAMDVILVNQAFDGRRARGRRAQALLAHRLAQFVVLHQLARAFHRR